MFRQARKLLRELKYHKRCEEAATTIAAYWHGTQVLESWQEVLLITVYSIWVPYRVQIHLSVWNFLFGTLACLLFLSHGLMVSQRFFNEARPEFCRCRFLFNPTLFCWSHSCHFSSPSSHCSLYHFPFIFSSLPQPVLRNTHGIPTGSDGAETSKAGSAE